MTKTEIETDVVVVGGGLAGLITAGTLARGGLQVVVLERALAPGGRARTAQTGEHGFNFGPHALYERGPLDLALRGLQVRTVGIKPPLAGARALLPDGRVTGLPVTLGGVLRAPWFKGRDAAELVRALRVVQRPPTGAPRPTLHELPAAAWIDGLAERVQTRAMLEALVRLSTYGGDLQDMSADVAQLQLAASLQRGVRYVHGGWQTLVDGLLATVERAGVHVQHARAARLDLGGAGRAPRGRAHRVLTADGRALSTHHVVLACAPGVAAALLAGADPGLARFAQAARPVTMRCVDLGLRGGSDLRFTLGVGAPFYFSPQRGVEGVGPRGGTTVHAGYYLGAEAPSAPQAAVAERLDAYLACVIPDHSERVVQRRVLPRAVVHHALPEWSTGGLRGRPPCASSVPGVWFAGDWVGPRGHLADASAASALDVAGAIAGSREGTLRWAS